MRAGGPVDNPEPHRMLRVSKDCLFCRIVAKEIPADLVHETDTTLAFRDIGPKAPVHVLVVPKAHHRTVGELANHDPVLAGQVLASAVAVAEREGLVDDGYRLIVNTGAHGGQEVDHVHVHVVGGAPLGPMLSR
jgi:histidine triad (HIT) family protein